MLSRILVIGGTGMIGQQLVTASLKASHPTAVLIRPATVAADPGKARLVEDFKTSGARLVYGDINDSEGLVAAIKQADVVISAVGHSSPEEVGSQLKIMAAIQEACNIKRFVPSEYGCNVELAEQMLEPARSILGAKLGVREALKESGIPHTIVCGYWGQGFLLPRVGDPEANGPPHTRATIFGDGNLQESPFPLNFQLAVVHATLVAGGLKLRAEATGVSAGTEVEATQLYPDMRYITVEAFLDALL